MAAVQYSNGSNGCSAVQQCCSAGRSIAMAETEQSGICVSVISRMLQCVTVCCSVLQSCTSAGVFVFFERV